MVYVDERNIFNKDKISKNIMKLREKLFLEEDLMGVLDGIHIKKHVLKKVGIIKNVSDDVYYESNSELSFVPLYAKAIITVLDEKEKYIAKIEKVVNKEISKEEAEKSKSKITETGIDSKWYVLFCKINAFIEKALVEESLMKEVEQWFKMLYKNIYQNFSKGAKHITVIDFVEDGISSFFDSVAYVFFVHRYAESASLYIWFPFQLYFCDLLKKNKEYEEIENESIQQYFYDFLGKKGIYPGFVNLTQDEVNEIGDVIERNKIKENEMFFEACRIIKSLQNDLFRYMEKEFDEAFDKSKEINENELEVQYEELEQKLKRQEGIIKGLEEEKVKIREKINEVALNGELQVNKLTKELGEFQKKCKELEEELEDYKEIEKIEEEEIVPDVKLQDKKILIIGGHQRWHNIIKKAYPNWLYINNEVKNALVDLQKVDGIFFYTKYMPHSLYHRFKSQCKGLGLPIHYITNLNIHAVEEEISKILG